MKTMSMISRTAGAVALAGLLGAVGPLPAGAAEAAVAEPTFSRDIAPILQRSCQKCHRPDALAPMSLMSYAEVRPWARAIKNRTGLRDKPGVMPPWYIERNIGIQDFKDDWSLSEAEIATIARWVDRGAPQGDPADLPPPRTFLGADEWEIGEPDLIISTPPFKMKGNAPDWWGSIGQAETGLTEDRYVAAVEYKERNDLERGVKSDTVGGLFIVHHSALFSMVEGDDPSETQIWPVHEVGRNADIFDANAGRRLRAGSVMMFPSTHLHANGTDTEATLEVAFRFHPVGYEPEKEMQMLFFGNGPDLDIRPNDNSQRADAYYTLPENTKISVFEPHMHAPGVRMCLEAVWGTSVQTLNCAGYDHNWVRVYKYDDDSAPLLPKGTILHLTGYFDTTAANANVVDPRNWSGSGHRSVDNMFINLMQAIYLSDEEFAAAVAEREEAMAASGAPDIGCLLCGAAGDDDDEAELAAGDQN